MFHIVFLVRKKPGMTQEAFTRYWIEEHTPITASVPGLSSYRCYPMTGREGDEPPFEAVAIVGFNDKSAWETARASPEMQAALADAPNFQLAEGTFAFHADEFEIV